MQSNTYKVTGPRTFLEELRRALVADPNAKDIEVSEPKIEPPPVRQLEIADILFAIIINVPTGALGNWLYAWLSKQLEGRQTDKITVQNILSSSPGAESAIPHENPIK
jgi:hypothetical protein